MSHRRSNCRAIRRCVPTFYHGAMMEFAVLLLLLRALAPVAGARLMARRRPRGQMVSGTLLVTGGSDSTSGPDSSGHQSATIAGVMNGPNLNEHVVYEQMSVDASQWPATQLSPVGDAPNNPGRVVLRTAGVTVRRLVAASAALVAMSWMMNVAPAQADPMCNEGGPPEGAATRAFDGGTVWVSPNGLVGVTTAGGTGSLRVPSASPMPMQALVVDAQGDGQKQLIVSDGRAAHLYLLEGCRINQVFDRQGSPFVFDLQNLRGNGTGVGCEDLGDGRHLVALQALPGPDGAAMRRTEITIIESNAALGRSDTVPATPAASAITCGAQTMADDGVQQP